MITTQLPPSALRRETRDASVVASHASLDITLFGALPDGKADCTSAVWEALEHCRRTGTRTLVFPAGRYAFHADRAVEEYVFISNNDEGLRRIAFPLTKFEDFSIEGEGAEFIFHGVILPFVIAHSQRVNLRGFSVDWEIPFHCEGQVISSDEDGIELEIAAAFPYKVVNGRFLSLGPSAQGWELSNMLEFDPVRRETAYGAQDNYEAGDRFRAEESGPRRVRFRGQFSEPRPTLGNIMLLTDSRRTCPGIFITDCEGLTLDRVTIYHAGGMGIVAQRSSDLDLQQVRVQPRSDGGRLISATADATHFASCRGRITLTDCVFETQVDDATNVHGVYTRVTARRGARTVEVRLMHPQQRGRHPVEVGHPMQFVCNDTLLPLHHLAVAGVRRINAEYTELSFAEPLPESVVEGTAALDLFWQPREVIIRGCALHGNRARGFLISIGGRVLIEDCEFHVPGAAVLIEGDANYWFEAGAVHDVTIRRNRFVNCNYGPWGKAAIQISPGIDKPHRQEPRYHRSVCIEDNQFEVFFSTLVDAQSVDGLVFRGNTVRRSDVYPAKNPDAQTFRVRDCSNVDLDAS